MSEFPQFFKVNQIKIDQDILIATTADGIVENCADYDRNTEWESIDSDDVTTEIVTVLFQTPDEQEENRSIDTVILIGCNAKDFRIYTAFWNGSSYDSWVLQKTVTESTIENQILSFTEVSCGEIKIEMDNTIVADEEKTISGFVATKLIWEATMPMDVFLIKNKQKLIKKRLYNGKAQIIYKYDKWASKLEFRQISQTELDEMRSIYDLHTAFIVILEPYDYQGNYDKPEDFYRVLWMTPWDQKYFTTIKGAGYNIKLSIEEV